MSTSHSRGGVSSSLAPVLAALLALAGVSSRGESQVLIGMLAGGALSSEKFNIGFET